MGVLIWLAIPLAATVLAVFWVHWAARPRGPVETHESLRQQEKFRAAMATKPAASARVGAPVGDLARVAEPQRRAS